MKLGFIGTGALTSAIVTGLKSVPDNSVSILLSPRNREIAAGLAARYADVQVAPDNQAVLDVCDTVLLAVRPQIAHEVLAALRFRRSHHVISLIATLSRKDISRLIAPAAPATVAFPMPMLAHRQGATLVCPPDPIAAALFGRLGKVVEVEKTSELNALGVVAATFATYFQYLDTIHAWLKHHGVAEAKGRDYIAAIYQALGNAPDMAPAASFTHLAQDYATRGGVNEQVLRELTARGMFEAFKESMDGAHRRLAGG
jgi:pyrroline-5-carboxylate reductase